MEFHDHIWNHHGICIEISTNMPGIGSVIREIAVKITEMFTILLSKTNARCVSSVKEGRRSQTYSWGDTLGICVNKY